MLQSEVLIRWCPYFFVCCESDFLRERERERRKEIDIEREQEGNKKEGERERRKEIKKSERWE